jgi:hypothetical protein
VLKGKFILLNPYIKNTERSQINDIRLLEKEELSKPKASRRREIIKNKGQNQWNRYLKNHTKNQWNKKLFLWKDIWDL